MHNSHLTAKGPLCIHKRCAGSIGSFDSKVVDVSEAYPTLLTASVCDASLVLIRSPSHKLFEFDYEKTYSHIQDDVLTEEIAFGRVKEKENKSRLGNSTFTQNSFAHN